MDPQLASMIRNLEEKTGKALDGWIAIVRALGPLKHGEILKKLKGDHGLTHGYANMIVHLAGQEGQPQPAGDDLVEAQYAGDKSSLRPILDRLLKEVARFGNDVEVSPKKAYVSLRRARQFALVQPTTKTRVDVGIQLKGTPPRGRLEASGSFNAMVSHRVKISSVNEVDAELIGWLRQAYDAAG